jgi:hypothetical protein
MRTQTLYLIQKTIDEVINLDKVENKKSTPSFSICLDGLYSVPTPNYGMVVEIDNNSMVLIQFEDNIGTTDWLPLSIMCDSILDGVYDSLTQMKNDLRKKI